MENINGTQRAGDDHHQRRPLGRRRLGPRDDVVDHHHDPGELEQEHNGQRSRKIGQGQVIKNARASRDHAERDQQQHALALQPPQVREPERGDDEQDDRCHEILAARYVSRGKAVVICHFDDRRDQSIARSAEQHEQDGQHSVHEHTPFPIFHEPRQRVVVAFARLR